MAMNLPKTNLLRYEKTGLGLFGMKRTVRYDQAKVLFLRV